VITGETHCGNNIGGVTASDNETGLAVDHAVPDFSRFVVECIVLVD